MEKAEKDKKIPALDSFEMKLKTRYKNGGQKYVDQPMTFSEYMERVRKGECILRDDGNLYQEKSENHYGYTIAKIGEVDKNFRNIFLVKHPRYSYPIMHNHNYVEIIYVMCGQCLHFVDEMSFIIHQGDVCMLAPNTMHALSVSDDDTVVIDLMVNNEFFDRQFLDMLRGGTVMEDFIESIFYRKQHMYPYVVYPTGDDEYLRQTVEYMCDEVVHREYAYEKSLELLTQQFFLRLIRKYEMSAEVSTPVDSELNNCIVAVLGYLNVNYNRTNLEKTAEFFGYTPTYLGKMLKKYTGKNYKDIITDIQMRKAKELLDLNELSIAKISQEVGCFDNSHFNKKFKAAYGMSPREYRKNKGE